MDVLIVENDLGLGQFWAGSLERYGYKVEIATTDEDAVTAVSEKPYDVVILDLCLREGPTFTVADYVCIRRPEAKVILITRDRFFSNGDIFNMISNTCAVIPRATPIKDMAALVAYHGDETSRDREAPTNQLTD